MKAMFMGKYRKCVVTLFVIFTVKSFENLVSICNFVLESMKALFLYVNNVNVDKIKNYVSSNVSDICRFSLETVCKYGKSCK